MIVLFVGIVLSCNKESIVEDHELVYAPNQGKLTLYGPSIAGCSAFNEPIAVYLDNVMIGRFTKSYTEQFAPKCGEASSDEVITVDAAEGSHTVELKVGGNRCVRSYKNILISKGKCTISKVF
ncbi:MAG: hypothetical protein EOO43_19250 [Flavobacterium sp.]|nr:MAG: hypothetical protein EOO43_19250 [Flavobacterium sp.]